MLKINAENAAALGMASLRWSFSRPHMLARWCMSREPFFASFGTEIPDDVVVRVHDSTADMRYLVLPQRPACTDGWSEGRLAKLVSRDAMIGVSLPRRP